MKRTALLYWGSTSLFCGFLLLTSLAYFTDPKFVEMYRHLGFPQYFRVELGIAKGVGALLLVLPVLPPLVKEWIYAGFFITLVSGIIAHVQTGDSALTIGRAFFFLGVLLVSYTCWHQRLKGTTLRLHASQPFSNG